MSRTPTPAEAVQKIRTKSAVNLVIATTALDVSVATGSRLIAAGKFPVPVVRMGQRVIIPTPALRELLQLAPLTETDPTDAETDPAPVGA